MLSTASEIIYFSLSKKIWCHVNNYDTISKDTTVKLYTYIQDDKYFSEFKGWNKKVCNNNNKINNDEKKYIFVTKIIFAEGRYVVMVVNEVLIIQ